MWKRSKIDVKTEEGFFTLFLSSLKVFCKEEKVKKGSAVNLHQ
jgi:hypothetical protein